MPGRTEVGDTSIFNTPIRRGRKEGVLVITGNVSDNFAILADMPPVIVCGASAARDLLMPAAAANNQGLCFTIISTSSTTTGVLTLKDSADSALSPAVTITQNLSVEMIYLHGIGWRKKAQ